MHLCFLLLRSQALSSELQQQLAFDPNAAQTYRNAVAEARKNAADQANITREAMQSNSSAPVAYASSPANNSGSGRVYVKDYQTFVGPRGGVYHYSASGKKVYEHR